MSDSPLAGGERRAWGWLAALRSGETTPWHAWTAPGERSGRFLPGAQQLELLRRLNQGGPPDPVLVERVLTASAPGRGRPDLQLVGAVPSSPFGPRPVDPADLSDAELLRVATNLLAEDLVTAGTPPPPSPSPTQAAAVTAGLPWARARRRPYRLVGDPWLADPVRAELVRRGRPPGGRRATVVVLGTDVVSLLRHAWTARSFDEGGLGWTEWLAAAVARDRLPPRANLPAMTARWCERVGSHRVRVVINPTLLPGVLGVRRTLPAAPSVPASGTDLARRTAAPLGLLVPPERRAALLRHTLLPRVLRADGEQLGVPTGQVPWVREQAERLHQGLAAADYPVIGSLRGPRTASTGGTGPRDADTLALAVRLLLEGAGNQEDGRDEVGG